MDQALDVVRYLIDLGPSVFLPLVMLILGLIIGLRFTRALQAGILLGVAFAGVGLVIGFIFGGVAPAGQRFVENTGVQLTAFDFGWTAAAAISWAWPYAVLMFPLQIAINLVMLALGWTRCLNVDMWNVWGKIFVAALMTYLGVSVPVAFIVAGLWVVLELKSADYTERQVQHLTKIPGISVPHLILFDLIFLAWVDRYILDRIPGLNKLKTDPQRLRERIGIFGENAVIGAILGLILGLIAFGPDAAKVAPVVVVAATGLVLMPKVAALFMEALAPIAEQAQKFMQSRFPGRQVSIGLDWPVLAGVPALWTAAIMLIPVILALAVLVPGNIVLPFGSILLIEATIGTVIIAQGDLIRTFILGALSAIMRLFTAGFFAVAITSLARATGVLTIPPEVNQVTWLGTPPLAWFGLKLGQLTQGQDLLLGIGSLVVLGGLIYLWRREMLRREALYGDEGGAGLTSGTAVPSSVLPAGA
jgi:PTS system galactitol-specific IIC component